MNKKNIETIVPLLPMQQGFLWQSLKDSEGAATLQLRCTLHAELDSERFKQAWHAVVQRHQALRSSVHWQEVKEPVQLVMKTVELPWVEIDLRANSDINASLEEHLQRDRQAALELTSAPVYRIALYQTASTTYEFVWTLSHVLLDGWSSAIILSEVIKHYSGQAQFETADKPATITLNDHHRWLKQQSRVELESYWSSYFPESNGDGCHSDGCHSDGCHSDRPVQRDLSAADYKRAGTKAGHHSETKSFRLTLDSPDWATLRTEIRQAGISLNACLQAAWAIQLLDLNTSNLAIFGITVSGREIDLPGANEHVGMLINLIPVAVTFDTRLSVSEWLKNIQNRFFASIPFAHASLQDIQTAADLRGQVFNSLLVLENQPLVESTDLIGVSNFRSGIVSDLDLTLVAIPGDDLTLELRFKSEYFVDDEMIKLLQQFQSLLTAIPDLLDSDLSCLRPYLNDSAQRSSSVSSIVVPAPEEEKEEVVSSQAIITRLEQQLLDIWQQVLNVPDISLSDNFFDLGGSSLQAVLIFERIQTITGFQLPTTILFKAPSIIKLASAIEQQDPHSLWSTTVEIQKEGRKPPLFIPVVSTDMLMYRNLSAHLGNDQPVYALRAADSLLSTEELAIKLAGHIRSIQAEGPYHLAGASGAGLLAWVTAQTLQAQNQQVALLALLDTYGPEYPTLKPPLPRMLSITAELASRLFSAAGRWTRNRLPYLPDTFKPASDSENQSSQISGIQVESNMHLLAEYNERIAQEYEEALPFVLDITRNQPLYERAINLLCLGMTRLRSGSFTMRMSFIVFIQGLWLEHRLKGLPMDKQINSRSIEVIKNRHEKMYASLQPYAGRIAYIRVTERPPAVVDDPYVGWSGLVSDNMTIFEVPGTHTSLLKHPNVGILAEILRSQLGNDSKRSDSRHAEPSESKHSLLGS